MPKGIKKNYPSSFKSKVALELLTGVETLAQVSSKHEIHPTQANQWKRRLLDGSHELFENRAPAEALKEQETLIEKLYSQIGQLTVERDWLKKKIGL